MDEKNNNIVSIILHDTEDNYYIAEINTFWDRERLEKEYAKLNNEFWEDDYDWDAEFYCELSNRTWLNIYEATILEF